MYIDTHCHLNFKAFQQDWKEVLEQSLREQVEMIIVGTDRITSEKAVEIAGKYSGVWATIGFHPIHVNDRDWRSEIQYIRSLANDKKVVAIGEVGLDYYVDVDTSDVKKVKTDQRTVFQFFLDIAQEVGKPLMLHCRAAEEEFLKILSSAISSSSERGEREISRRSLGLRPRDGRRAISGQWHCFGGTLEQAQKALEFGLNIGFTGLITYNNQWDEVIRQLPLDRILPETDAPYLTPVPYRGQRNEPRHVKEVVKKIAELNNVLIEEVERQIFSNAANLYKLS